MTIRHRHPDGLRAPHPQRTRWAAAGGVGLLVVAIASGAAIAYNDPPLTYEWAAPTEVSEPTARGGPLGPIPGPLSMPSIGACETGGCEPDAPATTAAPSSRCSRCGQRSEPAPTTVAPSSTVAAPPTVGETRPSATEPRTQPATDPNTGRARIVADTNTARTQLGCPPVTPHPDLDAQAQAHAQAMADDRAMYHSGGVTGFDSWGENVARGYPADQVVQAWMDSSGHRANIGTCDFTFLGVGYVDAPEGPYAVQQFASEAL